MPMAGRPSRDGMAPERIRDVMHLGNLSDQMADGDLRLNLN
jgi:hypothetical protein